MDVVIRFWGVRGSIARPGAKTTRYGGNTPCVEIRYGKELIMCDAGTGLYELGQKLARYGGRINGTFLFSHYHWDHIIGLPFFAPIYNKENSFTIIGRKGLKKALTRLLSPPNFPVRLSDFKARLKFKTRQNQRFKIGRTKIEAFDVNHPNGASGYVFAFPNGKKVVHISDSGITREAFPLREGFLDKIAGADLLIHDAQFYAEEYLKRKRFGHSPFQYVLDIARKADVKRVALFHHDPSRTDAGLKKLETAAKKLAKKIGLRAKVFAAREGMAIKI